MPMTSSFVVRSTIGLLSVALAALLLIVGATIWLQERAQRNVKNVAELRDLRISANLLREGLLAAESSQRGYLLTSNEIYLAPFENAKSVVQLELQRIVSSLKGVADRAAMVDRLVAVANDKIVEMSESIALISEGKSEAALAVIRSNRGKAMMDEANIFISAIVLKTDEQLTESVSEQNSNAESLRWTAIGAGLAIVLVISGVIITAHRYTSEITAARDEVREINLTLEDRVSRRTVELAQSRDRAELLLTEVNHRVANSLTLVASLVRLQSNASKDPSAKSALVETESRIQAIAEMHRHLFVSGDVSKVALDKYLTAVLAQLKAALVEQKSGIALRQSFEPLELLTKDAVNVGIIATEWVTNAFKYAYGDRRGEVRIFLRRTSDGVELVVEDDGVGRTDQKAPQGTGFGTRVVNAIATSMSAVISYRQRSPGIAAHLLIPDKSSR